jgi:hypothetical protein
MIVNFNVNNLERLDDISAYNYNYYKLPIVMDGCDMLYVENDEHASINYWTLGFMECGVFEGQFKFYTEHYVNEVNLLRNKIGLDSYLS